LTLVNTAEDRQRVLPALEEFARQHALPPAVLQAADLALEEHITNVLDYAYETGDPSRHEILLHFELDGSFFKIEVEDDGRPFNPLSRPPVDITLPPDEKSIGGLGIHLIRRSMDVVEYRRERDRNILTMRKRIR
jgi:anti-sigma regulatory factor (Ser/Thr protein kinase)